MVKYEHNAKYDVIVVKVSYSYLPDDAGKFRKVQYFYERKIFAAEQWFLRFCYFRL